MHYQIKNWKIDQVYQLKEGDHWNVDTLHCATSDARQVYLWFLEVKKIEVEIRNFM
jgi:hypothetical protein